MPIEGKSLHDQVFAVIKNFTANNKYNGVGYLIINVLQDSEDQLPYKWPENFLRFILKIPFTAMVIGIRLKKTKLKI